MNPRVWCWLVALLLLACASELHAKTYYVRADGGTAARCNGTADAPASAAPNCAWNAPTIPLPLGNSEYGGVIPRALIKAGDTLVIGSGSYMVGLGAPGNAGSICAAGQPYECVIASIPSGIDVANPTVITGDCSRPPELWASGSANGVFWLRNVHDVKIACLSVTDHSTCIIGYGPTTANGGVTACRKNSATDPFGMDGMQIVNVTNLTLDHVDIHGMAQYGITAGALHGKSVFNHLTLRANGWGGWNGDLGGIINAPNASDDGTLTFNNLVVAWNGCGEAYPSTTIVGCWGQTNGGYGDGFGTARTAGDWTFNNAKFYQNTSDGLDLLYHTLGGSITINGGVYWGNIGNQIKAGGNVEISRAVVNGMCNNFAAFPVGGAQGNSSNDCRAAGTAVVMSQSAPNQSSVITHSTITGNGDTLLVGKGADGASNGGKAYTPDKTNVWAYDNNIFLGQQSAYRAGGLTALDWYSDDTFDGTVRYVNNIVWNVKRGVCPPTSICKDPKLANETMHNFDPIPLPGSPAIGTARAAATPPPTQPNVGAVQH